MSQSDKKKCPNCKICCCPIKEGQGLQCQGACKTWLHFKCLNFSQSKINEIKCGNIKVLCPCPGCNARGKRCGISPSSIRVLKPGQQVVDCDKPESKSNSNSDCEGFNKPAVRGTSSDTSLNQAADPCNVGKCPSLATVELMCKKLEKLTCEINHIIVKMKDHCNSTEDMCKKKKKKSSKENIQKSCCSCRKSDKSSKKKPKCY